jgi:hypothetical protein
MKSLITLTRELSLGRRLSRVERRDINTVGVLNCLQS